MRFATAHAPLGARHGLPAALALAALLLCACDTDTIDHGAADGATDAGIADQAPGPDRGASGDGAGGHVIRIRVKGDTTPRSFSDGFAGQTPKTYVMGLARYELMTSATDPAPVVAFDHGHNPVDVDLLGQTLAGTARIADIPAGSYTHGRVLLTHSRFTIAATVHAGVPVPGTITTVVALSDTTINGAPWKQNQASFTFKAGTLEQTVPASLPALPSTGGGTVVQQGGKTWLVFPFPKPITISSATARDHDATIIYKVFESFRWQDETAAGYQTDVFDVDALKQTVEPVKNYGATGYAIELD